MDLTVVLDDPRLPCRYNRSQRLDPRDLEAVEALVRALRALPVRRLRRLDRHDTLVEDLSAQTGRTDLVLNFCNNGLGNDPARQLHVPALLEALGLAYVGADPACMALCHEKSFVGWAAREVGVPTPAERVVRPGSCADLAGLRYPCILKPVGGDGSTGISDRAVVGSPAEAARSLEERAGAGDVEPLLLQEFLPGRESSVGLIGNPGTGWLRLPPLEVDFEELDPKRPRIMTHASKADPSSPEWRQIRLRPAGLSAAEREQLWSFGERLFQRLGCRDYARMDFRTGSDGAPRLIDANAHPIWYPDGMLATMARHAGLDFPRFLLRLLEAAQRRLGEPTSDPS